MAVLLPDGRYALLRQAHPQGRDAHGTPIPAEPPAPTAPVDGAAARHLDGSWTLRLDPALWPVAAGDTISRAGDGRRWVVTGTPLLQQVPGHPDVDYVAVTAMQDPPDVDRGYPVRSVV
ncbi:hypothetical protein ABZ671_18585 [Micromonospora sp. NPDC006766]|uniref:hypothetical protein n=1 Tax=Micromonospora sp. NPDC006766 TaxID=3154778 RepID=UPI0034097E38